MTQSPQLTVMIRAAEKAAKSLLRDFGEVEQLQVSVKGPQDFVSAADHRAEEIIFAELSKTRPDYGFLMEERGEIHGKDPHNCRFIVDPLDGTVNFLHGQPHWSISIALERAGEIIAGLVYDPVRDEMFTAEKGGGAFLRGGRASKRLRVSGRKQLQNALIIPGFPPLQDRKNQNYYSILSNLFHAGCEVRLLGSAALELCYVAAGRCEGFWQSGLKPWDIAAGALIIREAGGVISALDGAKNPVYSDFPFASNANLQTELMAYAKKIG